ncbi:hypothetical protein [Desulfococcus sp.]|uniref:hypothetical protein n=1 Tax=Desulfococcus sp. TaxID=2025834 RepID=UPI0035942C76
MKQKYVIIKDDEKNALVLQEHAELDKELLSLLCEETYVGDMVADAVAQGKAAVMSHLRTRNMYPPSMYMDKIADQVMDLYKTGGGASAEVVFDDIELIVPDHEPIGVIEIEEDSADLDDLLDDEEDTLDDEFGDDDDLNISTNASLKIADDESLDIDDDA